MEDMKARLLAKRQQSALAKLVRHLEQAHGTLRASKRQSERKAVADDSLTHLQDYVHKGLDVNAISEDLRHVPGTPVWFAWACMVDSVFSPTAAFEQRSVNLDPVFELLAALDLAHPIVGDRSLTGMACSLSLWGVAGRLCATDPGVSNAPCSVYHDCIQSSSQSKVIAPSLAIMDAAFQVDQQMDRTDPADGITPLMRAAAMSNVEQVAWLLARGADVNAMDERSGATAIMHALDRRMGVGDTRTRKRVRPTLELLLDAGADLALRPVTGESFEQLVLQCKALVDRGADEEADDPEASVDSRDREYFLDLWQRFQAANPERCVAPFGPGDLTLAQTVPQDQFSSFVRRTDLILLPHPEMLLALIYELASAQISRFTATDIAFLLDPAFHGFTNDVGRNLSVEHLEMRLNELVLSRRGDLSLTRDPQTGMYLAEIPEQETYPRGH